MTAAVPKLTTLERIALATLVVLRAGLDTSRYLANPLRYWNWEDNYNAAVGWYALHAGLWDQLLALQYKQFCGGCTVESVLVAPMFLLGGDHIVIWKALALLWTAATLVAGFLALRLWAGREAGWAFALLFALPPLGMSDLSLMLWGNHNESMLFVFVALWALARGRVATAGLSMGVGLWFCRTTLFAPLILVPWAMWGERATSRVRLLVGLAAGAALLLLPAAGGDVGTYNLGITANLLPDGLAAAWTRATPLWQPEQAAMRLFVTLNHDTVATTAWLGSALLALTVTFLDRRRGPSRFVLPAFALVFALLYASSGFPIPRMSPQGALMNMRYYAPWMQLLTALTACSALGIAEGASERSRTGLRGWVGRAAVLGMFLANASGWAAALPALKVTRADLDDLWATRAVNHDGFVGSALLRLSDDRLARASSTDPRTDAALKRMRGYRAAAYAGRSLPTDVIEAAAFAQALTDPVGGWQHPAFGAALLDRLPVPVATAIGRGRACNLLYGVSSGAAPVPGMQPGPPAATPVARAIARGRDLLDVLNTSSADRAPDNAPCYTCAAIGPAVADLCRDRKHHGTADDNAFVTCLGEALKSLPFGEEMAWGAGVACVRPGAPPRECRSIGQALAQTATPEISASFLEGTDDPIAGMERPVLVPGVGGK